MNDDLMIPPHSNQAEQAVLGGLMIDQSAWFKICEILKPDDFYLQSHRLIFKTLSELAEKRSPLDIVHTSEELDRIGAFEQIGGMPYLGQLKDNTPTAANIRSYAKMVRECSVKRNLVAVGTKIVEGAMQKAEASEIINIAESAFLAITDHRESTGPKSASEIFSNEYSDEIQSRADGVRRGIATGFIDLDKLTNGLRPGQLIINAARPAVGKSVLAINVAGHIAVKLKKPVLIFSLEMTKAEIMDRLVSSISSIPLDDILKGDVSGDRFNDATRSIVNAPLYIDDTGGLFLPQLRTRALRIKRKHGLGLLVIDYLQLVRMKAENRFQEVSEISRALKSLAKELSAPILLLSQLSRDVDKRMDHRPVLSDLRESGQIEQDADLVSFLYREEMYKPNSPMAGTAELIIAKQRSGPTGKVFLTAQLDRARFCNSTNQAFSDQGNTTENYDPYE